jgi:hypothetical protein
MRSTATKAGRLELQKYEFTTLTNKGYSREDYGDLKIFTLTDDSSTWIKVYKGTAAKELTYKRYRTEAQALENITNLKANHDSAKKYKAELKANPTKSSHSNCAAAIREELKKLFPLHKFSVRSESFAGGNSVNVYWNNGLTVPQVDTVIKKYQYGSFNGMEDIYEHSNSREDIAQAKYVSSSRTISDELREAVKTDLIELRPDLDHHGYDNINDNLHRLLYDCEIPLNGAYSGLVVRGENEPYSRNFYNVSFDVPEIAQTEAKESANFETVEVPAGEIQIIEYSEKAIAVIGETKPIKDQLKEIGGKFNFRLSCGPGWIFSKKQLAEVQKLLSGEAVPEEAEQKKEKIYDGLRDENGAFNIPAHLQCFDHSGTELTNTFKREETTLKDEVKETINFLAELDRKNTGQVSESVKECAKVQEVEIYSSLDDINEAAEGGKVISLCNLFELVNQ